MCISARLIKPAYTRHPLVAGSFEALQRGASDVTTGAHSRLRTPCLLRGRLGSPRILWARNTLSRSLFDTRVAIVTVVIAEVAAEAVVAVCVVVVVGVVVVVVGSGVGVMMIWQILC